MLLWLVLGCINTWIGGYERDMVAEMSARGHFVLAGARALPDGLPGAVSPRG
jgi:hypothetical protein